VDVGLDGDIKISVNQINEALKDRLPAETRKVALARVEQLSRKKPETISALYETAEREKSNIPVSPTWLIKELAAVLDPATILVDEVWSNRRILQQMINFSRSKSYFRGSGPSIGWGLPGSLGIKLALPDRNVVAIVGDGSAIWSIQSLWTAASLGISVTFIILNNKSYGLIKGAALQYMKEHFKNGKLVGVELQPPSIDFCQLAKALGIQAQKVEHPDKLRAALSFAITSGKPNLLEVVVDGRL
jgi:benzoylformate decarboxylase